MEKIHINDLFNIDQLKLSLETYSKIRSIDSNKIIDCLIKSINDYFKINHSDENGTYSIKYENNKFKLLLRDKLTKDQTITVENKNEVIYQINKQFLVNLNNLRLDYCREQYNPEKLGLIEVKVNKIYKNFILCTYKNDLEVWLDYFNLIRGDRIKEDSFIKVIPEIILLNGDEIRMKATRRGITYIEELIKDEVPEVKEGIVLIKHIQRKEGIKTYIVVQSTNDFLDPIKSLIGIQGSRINEIKRNLPERLEIIPWSTNPQVMIKDVFKNNLLNMNVIDHNKFKLELLNLPSNYYPEIELNLILSIFPSLDLTYDLLDEDTDNRE